MTILQKIKMLPKKPWTRKTTKRHPKPKQVERIIPASDLESIRKKRKHLFHLNSVVLIIGELKRHNKHVGHIFEIKNSC